MTPAGKPKILLISYTFPPTPGIGGRRWAKFTKFLAGEFDFHVIHSDYSFVGGNFWDKDVSDSMGITRYPLKFRFGSVLANANPNLFQKLAYKGFMMLKRFSKLNFFDNAAFAGHQLFNKVRRIVREQGIDLIVVTGPPHTLYYHGVVLKQKLGIKVVLDYRDRWNGHPFYDKMQHKTSKQLKYSVFQERYALRHADAVITVDESMQRALIELNDGNNPEKFITVANGYDREDFRLDLPKVRNENLRILFAGNIAIDLDDQTIHFVRAFLDFQEKEPVLARAIVMEFYVRAGDRLHQFLSSIQHKNFVYHNDFLSSEAYYRKLREIDYGVVILSQTYSGSFITKFSDYIGNHNQILQVGCAGPFSDFIKAAGIGCTFTPQDDYTFFRRLKKDDGQAYANFNAVSFDLQCLSQRLKDVLLQHIIR